MCITHTQPRTLRELSNNVHKCTFYPLPQKMVFSGISNNIHLVFLSSRQVRRLFSGITRVWSTVRWASCHSTTLTKVRHWKNAAQNSVLSVWNGNLRRQRWCQISSQPPPSRVPKAPLHAAWTRGKILVFRLHLSHQSNRPGFPDWALRPTLSSPPAQ